MPDPRAVTPEGQALLDYMKAAQEALQKARLELTLGQPVSLAEALEECAGASLAAADLIRKAVEP